MKSPFLDLFEELFQSYPIAPSQEVLAHIEKLKELDDYFPLHQSFLIVSDMAKRRFLHVSQNFDRITGIDSQKMLDGGIPYWLSLHHPADKPVIFELLADLVKMTIADFAEAERTRILYTLNFRIRVADGRWANIVQHLNPLHFDKNGRPMMGLSHITVIGFDEDMPIKGYLQILNTSNVYETRYYRNYTQKMLMEQLTNRERDIIRELALGKSSKQIAEGLFLSPHTVDTHRRNILKKLKISSTAELRLYFKDQGLV
ncbi:LuxR C-terminal-related transcriptional regulator [Pontibacter sp. G13]|uniref:LuxR C-terminal-related transcriptional regulator n=1 Tax=Pontibacter sp. G13 TaxID=3074898 RepID=UPI0028895948|nr:LuxR C-terminal-related transcriptional regulator [Pontibacter sp. G13]WNJ16833.1 LuxR C-terminal-related transcriptional regulator [Pontibacter sp. G13]